MALKLQEMKMGTAQATTVGFSRSTNLSRCHDGFFRIVIVNAISRPIGYQNLAKVVAV